MTVGICLPMEINQLTDDEFGLVFKAETALQCTSSLTDLVGNPDENINCFLDKTNGVFYRRFTETKVYFLFKIFVGQVFKVWITFLR